VVLALLRHVKILLYLKVTVNIFFTNVFVMKIFLQRNEKKLLISSIGKPFQIKKKTCFFEETILCLIFFRAEPNFAKEVFTIEACEYVSNSYALCPFSGLVTF